MYEFPNHLWEYIVDFDVRLMCIFYPEIKPTRYNKQIANYCVMYNIHNVLQYLLENFKIPQTDLEDLYETGVSNCNNYRYYDTESVELLMTSLDINSKRLYPMFIDTITYRNIHLIDLYLKHNIKITLNALEMSSWYLDKSWHNTLRIAYGFS